ncbi:MAG: hypothetical protein QW041_00890 [Candidatus Pacearchaeota archaeon]
MLPKWHILIGFLVTIILKLTTQFNDIELGLFFLSTFLIDFDHYLYYTLRKKDFSLENAYKWFIKKKKEYLGLSINERKKYKKALFIFHTIEFWILLAILFTYLKIFFFILIGILLHIFIDQIEIFFLKESPYFKVSLIITLIKNKNKKEFY